MNIGLEGYPVSLGASIDDADNTTHSIAFSYVPLLNIHVLLLNIYEINLKYLRNIYVLFFTFNVVLSSYLASA